MQASESIDNTAMRRSRSHRRRGFTLVELLVVVLIIVTLSKFVLSLASYAHYKSQLARAQSEIQAMSSALENYKADNGSYPENSATDALNARTNSNSESDPATVSGVTYPAGLYAATSQYLYGQLSGDTSFVGVPAPGAKVYMQFKPSMLMESDTNGISVGYIVDPFGFSYGYSTINQYEVRTGVAATGGYNPTYDLWSTSGKSVGSQAWVTNW